MRRLALALAIVVPAAALAQSLPQGVPGNQGLYYGFIPSAANWNTWFRAKQDWIGTLPYTVATLPACGVSTQYDWAVVTDATAPTYRGALTGSGTVVVPVFCDGVAWLSH